MAVLSVFLNLNIIFLGTLMFTYSYHELEEVMKATMKFYGTDYKVTTVWKAMESNLNCSGVNSSLDWKEIKSNEFVKDLHGCLAKLTYEEANLYGFFAVIFAFLLIVKLCCWRPCVECVKMSCFGGFTATSVESLDCPNLRSAATNEDVASSTQTTSTTQTIANPHYVVNLRKYGGPTEI